MRLRPLTEAECYARCYGGGWRGESGRFVNVLRARETPRATSPGVGGEPLAAPTPPGDREGRLEAA